MEFIIPEGSFFLFSLIAWKHNVVVNVLLIYRSQRYMYECLNKKLKILDFTYLLKTYQIRKVENKIGHL